MSIFTATMYENARTSSNGMVTGEPTAAVRHTWGEVHERARRVAGGLAAAGIGPGDAVGVLAGAPVEIAPVAQGLWMRGASLTMLHQPTPRTDLMQWAEDTGNVIDMIQARAVVSLRFALSGAEPVDPTDVEELCSAGAPFGLKPEAILPAYGMAETTVAVSFSELSAGLVVDEVDADMLCALHRAVPSEIGHTIRLATLGPLLADLEARVVDESGAILPARGVGAIELRGKPLSHGYLTMGGYVATQDGQGWFNTGDLGYLTERGHVVVCGRIKDVIIMGGRNVFPTDVERAAGRVNGVRPGCAVAVRLDAGHSRESFSVAVESNAFEDAGEVRRIKHEVAHEVVAEVDMRPRNVVVLGPGSIPKTPSGKLRRAHSLPLVS
jgi:fatty-acyl-CoA synthase